MRVGSIALLSLMGGLAVASEPGSALAQEPEAPKPAVNRGLSEDELTALSGQLQETREDGQILEALRLSLQEAQILNTRLQQLEHRDPERFEKFIKKNQKLLNALSDTLQAIEDLPQQRNSGYGIILGAVIGIISSLTLADLCIGEKSFIINHIASSKEKSRQDLKTRIDANLFTRVKTDSIDLLKEFKEELKSGKKRSLHTIQRACHQQLSTMEQLNEKTANPQLKQLLRVLINIERADLDTTNCESVEEVQDLTHALVDLGIGPLNSALKQFLINYSPPNQPNR